MATTKRLLGNLARDEGNYELAAQRYNEALEIASRLGDQPETGRLFIAQGELMINLKQPQYAIQLLSGALTTYKEIGHAKRSSESCTSFATSLPKPGTGMAGTKSGSASLEDDLRSGSASPGYPAASTATSSAGKLTRRVVGVVVATWVIRCEKQLIRAECTSISLIAFCFQERIVQVASTHVDRSHSSGQRALSTTSTAYHQGGPNHLTMDQTRRSLGAF